MEKIQNLVKQNLCTGCGVCASVCPRHCLTMQFTDHGQYNPVVTDEGLNACTHCGLCSSSCSFLNDFPAKEGGDSFGYSKELGVYLSCWLGHRTNQDLRDASASGGITTALLEYLLASKQVDAVICAKHTRDTHPFVEPVLCRTVEEVRACCGSFYYPVEFSKVLQQVLQEEGRYAIVALPCVLTSLTLASQKNAKLRRRMAYKIGLTCGAGKNAAFTDYLIKKNMPSISQLTTLKYRHCEGPYASDYQFVFNGFALRPAVWGNLFAIGAFNFPGCSYCDDVFAENADVVLMDAWLPECIRDIHGANLIVSRTKAMDEILPSIPACQLEPVSADKVVYSQKKFASPVIDKQVNNIYYANRYPMIPRKMRFEETPVSWVVKKKLSIRRRAQELVDGHYRISQPLDEDFDRELAAWMKRFHAYTQIERVVRKVKKILKIY